MTQNDAEIFKALHDNFKYHTLRPGQLQIIESILQKKDVLVCKENGYGKTLCYQLAGVMRQGVVVVVSSMTSRLESKFQQMFAMTLIKCEFLKHHATSNENSAKSQDLRNVLNQKNKVLEDLQYAQSSGLKFLFVTLDYIVNSQRLKQILKDLRKDDMLLSLVVEGIHCKNPWDPKHKQDLKNMRSLRSICSYVPILCFTRPLSEEKLDVLKDVLMLKNPFIFNEPSANDNICIKVAYKQEAFPTEKLVNIITEMYAGKYGLIYCHNEENCQTLLTGLARKQASVAYYTPQLTDDEKLYLSRPSSNGLMIVCESGTDVEINLPRIDFVVHTNMPSSLDIYIQEAFKAGTNTTRGECNVFYSLHDYDANLRALNDAFLKKVDSEESSDRNKKLTARLKDHRREIFDGVIYGENINLCRQVFLMQYFNQEAVVMPCGNCDVCNIVADSFSIDMSFTLKKILLAVWDINRQQKARVESGDFELIAVSHVVSLLIGNEEQQFKGSWLIDEWFYGSFHSWDKKLLDRLFLVLLSYKYLKVNQVANENYEVIQNLIITPKGQQFVKLNNELIVAFSQKDVYVQSWIKEAYVLTSFWRDLTGVLFYYYTHDLQRHLPENYDHFVEYLYHAIPDSWNEFVDIKAKYVQSEISNFDRNLFSVCLNYCDIIKRLAMDIKGADATQLSHRLRSSTKAESLEGFISDESFGDLLNIRFREVKQLTPLASVIGTKVTKTIDTSSLFASAEIIDDDTRELIITSTPLKKRDKSDATILLPMPASPTSIKGCNSMSDVVNEAVEKMTKKHLASHDVTTSTTAKKKGSRDSKKQIKRSIDEVEDHRVSSSTEVKRVKGHDFYRSY